MAYSSFWRCFEKGIVVEGENGTLVLRGLGNSDEGTIGLYFTNADSDLAREYADAINAVNERRRKAEEPDRILAEVRP